MLASNLATFFTNLCSSWFPNVLVLLRFCAFQCAVLASAWKTILSLQKSCVSLSLPLEKEPLEGRHWISSLWIPAPGTEPGVPQVFVEPINQLKKKRMWDDAEGGEEKRDEDIGCAVRPYYSHFSLRCYSLILIGARQESDQNSICLF